ncbi:MAG: esterase family protein [Oscillospiraceae bacterium]|nr:esterase family protein [Oscillospiraceae bacterium]
MKKTAMILVCLALLSGCTSQPAEEPPVENSPAQEETPTPSPTPDPTPSPSPAEPSPSVIEMEDIGLEDILTSLESADYSAPENYDKLVEGVTYGEITEVEYDSKTTGSTRKCLVYTPPGYNEDTTYPVLYLLHGIGGNHTEWRGGNPNEVLSNLLEAGEAPPMVAVMPNIRAAANDNTPSDVFSAESIAAFDNFINDLRDDLMPFIQENYSVSDKREDCAVAGLSMGGREALFIGVSMPDTFGYFAAFSPAPGLLSSGEMPGQLSPEEMTLPDEYKDNTFILICNGNQDTVVYDNPLNYHNAFDSNGIRHAYYTIDGGHYFGVWKHGLYYFAKNIFKGNTDS